MTVLVGLNQFVNMFMAVCLLDLLACDSHVLHMFKHTKCTAPPSIPQHTHPAYLNFMSLIALSSSYTHC